MQSSLADRPLDVGHASDGHGSQLEVISSDSSSMTGLIYSAVMMLHAHPASSTSTNLPGDSYEERHPEAPERISRAFQLLKENGCVKRMRRIQPREVYKEEVALIHDLGVWEGVYRSQFYTREALHTITSIFGEQSSLYINEHTFRSARLSCGGVIELCDAVCSGKIRNGFAIVRPPGHHAEPDRSMGFCMFNNVAVAASWVKEKYGGEHIEPAKRIRKILILDWDVHHGNGTQKAFEEDDEVLYISLHRYDDGEFYPGTTYGRSASLGSGKGKGYSINIPWPGPLMGDGEYLYAFHQVVMPIAAEFGPDLVIISAGFDAAKSDPLGNCLVTEIGYAQMTYMLMSLANGRVVVALEGGYNVEALAKSALSVTRTLLGDPVPSHATLPSANVSAVDTLRLVKRDVSPHWKSVESSPLDSNPAIEEGLPRYSLAELLRAHRQYEIGKRFELSEMPIIGALAEAGWGAHALCNGDLMERDPPQETVVVFVHDMGSLRAGSERPNLALVPETESAYLIDSSTFVLEWAKSRDYGIVDINLFPSPPQGTTNKPGSSLLKADQDPLAFLEFIWDNYLDLSDSANLLLIGHASASKHLLSLLRTRRLDLNKRVRAMTLTLGHEPLPMLPRDEPELRKWYLRNGRVYLPTSHAWWSQDEESRKRIKRGGKIVRVEEGRAIQVLKKALPEMVEFLEGKLPSKDVSMQLEPVVAGMSGVQGSSEGAIVPPIVPGQS